MAEKKNRKARAIRAGMAALALSAGGTVALQASPANASGWLGACYPVQTANYGGGWCDGNGPDGKYAGWVICGSTRYWGPTKWAGDRSSSYAFCPPGFYSSAGGVLGWVG